MLGAAGTWAIGTVLQKKFPVAVPVSVYTAWIMLIGGIPIFAVAAVTEAGGHPPISLQAWLAIAYNVFVAFAWAHWAWIKIATSVSVSVFSISMLLIPRGWRALGMLFSASDRARRRARPCCSSRSPCHRGGAAAQLVAGDFKASAPCGQTGATARRARRARDARSSGPAPRAVRRAAVPQPGRRQDRGTPRLRATRPRAVARGRPSPRSAWRA